MKQLLCFLLASALSLTGFSSDYYSEVQLNLSSPNDIDIDAPEGWDVYLNNPDEKRTVTVAVIDTGIDFAHPDLIDHMWINRDEIPDNGIDDDGNGYIDDIYGWDFYNNDNTVCHYGQPSELGTLFSSKLDCDDHGTHCAGTIAASADNEIGIAGIASVGDVRIMSLKIHGGANQAGKISDAIKAIRYAERMGASVCNISWGSYSYSEALYAAIAESNMLFVCAAGNDGNNDDELPLYPACFDLPNIISVGYVNSDGLLADHSNYGSTTVDIVVPAVNVFSTIVGDYSSMSGSSMAAPQISAVAALIYSCLPGCYASQVRELILANIKPLESCVGKISSPGLPSLADILNATPALDGDLLSPEFEIHTDYLGNNIILSFDSSDHGESGVHSLRYLSGRRDLNAFAKGTLGTPISDSSLALMKDGYYSFYINDYAGNETVKTTRIMDDIVAPVATGAAITMNMEENTISYSATVLDCQSGVKTVKVLSGVHEKADFKSSKVSALTIGLDGNISFTASEQGTYTLYMCDFRGNSRLIYIMAYFRPGETIRQLPGPEVIPALIAEEDPTEDTLPEIDDTGSDIENDSDTNTVKGNDTVSDSGTNRNDYSE